MRQMSGYSDLDAGNVVDGAEAFRQRHYHILLTPPGSLPQDPEWGFGLFGYLGKDVDGSGLRSIEAAARAAHLKDPETADATVRLTLVEPGRYRYAASLTMKSGVVVQLDRVITL